MAVKARCVAGGTALGHAEVDHRAARSWCFVGRAADLASLRRIVAWETERFGIGQDATESTVLAVDELATNALVFGAFELRLYTDPIGWGIADACPMGTADVAVHLTGNPVPSLEENGRGLLIVGALFPDFQVRPTTVQPDRPGKEVCFWLTGRSPVVVTDDLTARQPGPAGAFGGGTW